MYLVPDGPRQSFELLYTQTFAKSELSSPHTSCRTQYIRAIFETYVITNP
jgi:hypothetical protein